MAGSCNLLSPPSSPFRLPQIAAKVSAPLAKVDEIVILSGDNNKLTSDVNRLLAEVPVSVHALTGVDLTKVIWRRGACLFASRGMSWLSQNMILELVPVAHFPSFPAVSSTLPFT